MSAVILRRGEPERFPHGFISACCIHCYGGSVRVSLDAQSARVNASRLS